MLKIFNFVQKRTQNVIYKMCLQIVYIYIYIYIYTYLYVCVYVCVCVFVCVCARVCVCKHHLALNNP